MEVVSAVSWMQALIRCLDNSSAGIVITDNAQQILYANPNALLLFGQEDLTPQTILSEWFADDEKIKIGAIYQSLTSTPIGDLPTSLSLENTQGNMLKLRLQHSVTPTGEVYLLFNIFKAKNTPRNRELYALLAENSIDVIALYNHRNECVYMSPAITELSGYTPNEMENSLPFSLVYAPDKEQVWATFQEGISKRMELQTLTYRIKPKNGAPIWVETRIKRTFKSDNTIKQTVVAVRNIQLRVEAEEKALKAKDEFISVMSHEIRTPMNAVISMAELLLHKHPRHDQRELLETLQFSAQNLLGIINDVLDFSKIQAQKLELEYAPFDLHRLLKNIKKTYKHLADKKNIKLKLHIEEDTPQYVIGDSLRLSQILNNLITNAIKFTHEGGIHLQVQSFNISGGKVAFHFTVADTGIGIPPDKQEYIFEAFRQASGDTTRKYGGSGLGLAITKKLVDLHGGKIKLESAENAGATFTFEIIYQLSSEHVVEQNTAKDWKLTNVITVLYVEDNPTNQFVMKSLLEGRNVELTTASSGKEALLILQKQRFDVILMDIQMPDMDGFQTTKLIRETTTRTPIIAVTAETSVEIRQKTIEMNMADCLPKPIELPKLIAALAQITHQPLQPILSSNASTEYQMCAFHFDFYDKIYGEDTQQYIIFLRLLEEEFRNAQNLLVEAIATDNLTAFRNIRHALISKIRATEFDEYEELLDKCKHKLESGEAINKFKFEKRISKYTKLFLAGIFEKIKSLQLEMPQHDEATP